jgi:hypothetical protein
MPPVVQKGERLGTFHLALGAVLALGRGPVSSQGAVLAVVSGLVLALVPGVVRGLVLGWGLDLLGFHCEHVRGGVVLLPG